MRMGKWWGCKKRWDSGIVWNRFCGIVCLHSSFSLEVPLCTASRVIPFTTVVVQVSVLTAQPRLPQFAAQKVRLSRLSLDLFCMWHISLPSNFAVTLWNRTLTKGFQQKLIPRMYKSWFYSRTEDFFLKKKNNWLICDVLFVFSLKLLLMISSRLVRPLHGLSMGAGPFGGPGLPVPGTVSWALESGKEHAQTLNLKMVACLAWGQRWSTKTATHILAQVTMIIFLHEIQRYSSSS